VRADTDAYPELTQWFFDWVNTGGKMIGCVTVPAEKPIFDFLLTSRIDAEGVTAELLELDPTGEALRIMEVMGVASLEGADGNGEDVGRGNRFDGGGGRSAASSSQMLESIEEIVTGHGAIRDILGGFEQKRFLAVIDQAMDAYGSWGKARAAVNRQLQDWQDDFERLIDIETQLDKRLHQLQEDTVAARSRPASTLIQFLIEYGAGAAQRHSRALRFTPCHQTELIDSICWKNSRSHFARSSPYRSRTALSRRRLGSERARLPRRRCGSASRDIWIVSSPPWKTTAPVSMGPREAAPRCRR
jgi:two-component system chemotaxis sensor kinase CheA